MTMIEGRATGRYVRTLGPEGQARHGSDSRPERGSGVGHAAVLPKADSRRRRQGAPFGGRECGTERGRRRRYRPDVRVEVLRRSGAVDEAHPAGADGRAFRIVSERAPDVHVVEQPESSREW
ncbi:hypothetical protein GBAR_LOCUS8955 [Geodia barretti]|uniref:Uncharacterized protein n=1 Tax=Geodia barretti TaxID=519541 RepID=A0AA35RMK0_GEOBA|nr:hypothetical protein GBAR_LOCUS8955 [Geodia barretti]